MLKIGDLVTVNKDAFKEVKSIYFNKFFKIREIRNPLFKSYPYLIECVTDKDLWGRFEEKELVLVENELIKALYEF